MVIVSIRDYKAEVFMRPFFAQATGAAVRMFQDEVNRDGTDNMLYRHPEDFGLFEIGLFDDFSGEITPHDVKKLICEGINVTTKEYNLPKGISVVK